MQPWVRWSAYYSAVCSLRGCMVCHIGIHLTYLALWHLFVTLELRVLYRTCSTTIKPTRRYHSVMLIHELVNT